MPSERKYATERNAAWKMDREMLSWKRYARVLRKLADETDPARVRVLLVAKAAHESRYGVKRG